MTRTFGLEDPSSTNEYYNYQVANTKFYGKSSHHVINVREKLSMNPTRQQSQNYSAYRKKYKVVRDEPDYFFRAMGPIIRFGQFITLMPIVNCLDTNRRNVKFKWLSFQTFKTIFGIGCTLLEFYLLIKLVGRAPRTSLNIIWAVVFNICGCLAHIILFGIAMNWHRLIREWTWRESAFLRPPYKQLKYSLKFKLRLVTFLVVSAAIVEHFLFLSQIIYPIHKRNQICDRNQTVLEQFYFGLRRHYAVHFDYSIYILLITEWINFTMTIGWIYLDVLIVTISVALSSRLEQINHRMKSLKTVAFNEQTWNEIREQYMKITELITYVDRYFGFALILSCASNMYFICQQVYNSVQIDFAFPINRIYFWLSLSFIVAKTCVVLFSATRINDLSNETFSILRHISLAVSSEEIERFMEYLSSDTISLSGLNYFYVTRRFIFAMVGTIITYEILLFDKLDFGQVERSDLCT